LVSKQHNAYSNRHANNRTSNEREREKKKGKERYLYIFVPSIFVDPPSQIVLSTLRNKKKNVFFRSTEFFCFARVKFLIHQKRRKCQSTFPATTWSSISFFEEMRCLVFFLLLNIFSLSIDICNEPLAWIDSNFIF